ncbi:uncharacterized protein M437DRAFT_79319 [Aureobasidium melanogenum CBS 110374]|uniref:Zn(2)-C6 fungal-type domain-containing protein n=1 Tax=Aureobasidium melanogenum (strain CBS 110374) TaxID=1043003 RepID=A0A074VK74_AURM1|nr:uncharacterized protein M437DRAFT_79319 [Aureobasidium melanogenum CBS 110374]KEQ58032.1 hypothetical protein M437DRAFT_79319 [Aureobasidium melanogenum CBS 110374]
MGNAPRACSTCRQRKIKCDKAKPSCAACVKAEIECKAVKTRDIQFVDTTQAVAQRYQRIRTKIKASPSLEKAMHPDIETQALAFFARYYLLDPVPNGGPHPGLFGHVMPAVSASRNSAAAIWRMDRSLAVSNTRILGRVIKSLSDDLQKHDSRRSDLTLLTTLLLQFHSAFESLLFCKKSRIVHHLGALALVKEFGHPSTWSAIAREFVGCLIHLDITAAIREKRQVHTEVRYWSSVIHSTSTDAIRHLDILGIQVADMQFRACTLSGGKDICLSSTEVYKLLNEIQELDQSLVLWQGLVSRFWGPFSWTPSEIISPPIQAFQRSCHVYTSINAARRMNDLRSYRLSLALVSLKLIGDFEKSNPEFCTSNPSQNRFHVLERRIQWLVDGFCESVPFCLGNRNRVGTLLDFDDPIWTFPTCHDMTMSEMYGLNGRPAEPVGLVSPSDHYGHALTQGSWLMLSNLALLVATFTVNNILTPSFSLKDGQLPWICHQYLRNLSLNSIKWTHDSSLVESVLTGLDLPPTQVLISEASRCVRCVSRGLQLIDDL